MMRKIFHLRRNIPLLRPCVLLAALLACIVTEGKQRISRTEIGREDHVVTNPIDLAYAFTRDDKTDGGEGSTSGNYHKVARMQLKNAGVLQTEDTLYWGVGTTGSGSTPIRAAEQPLSSGVATEIGRASASDTEARIFVTPESLLYVYTKDSVDTTD